MTSNTSVVTSNLFAKHLTGPGHPECPERISKIQRSLRSLQLPVLPPRLATTDELALCHDPAYIKDIRDLCGGLKPGELKRLHALDATVCRDSYETAQLSAGAALTAIDDVCLGRHTCSFSAARPPGHHAESNQAMGFCLFNNAAIAARYAQKNHAIKKVLIVDWDVHHGNGTQEITENDPSIYYFSTHSRGQYPGTGLVRERGCEHTNENHPIQAKKGVRKKVLEAVSGLKKTMESFKPDLVIISAGFDAHELDPLGQFDLTDEDFVAMTSDVKEIAAAHCKGRIVSILEGGYNLDTIGRLAKNHVAALNLDTHTSHSH